MKELKLTNENNILECDAFVKINLAPGQLKESDFDQVYLVKHNGKDIFVKIVDILRVSFSRVSSIMTLPATGHESHEWRRQWREKHADTTDDTEMAVYYYKKV